MRKIVLNVSSAKVVNTNDSKSYGQKKKYMETLGREGEIIKSINDMDNIIHVNHIVNALHVMLGARPVSFKYGDKNQLSKKIINIVENGIIRFDNVFKGDSTFKNGESKTIFYNEFTQGKKSARDSNRNGLLTISSNGEEYNFVFTWSSLRKKTYNSPNYLTVYNTIIDFANKMGIKNVEKEYTLIDFIILLRDNHPDFSNKINEIKEISPIKDILNKIPSNGGFNSIKSPNLAGLGNVNAPTPKVSINATIILFMEDDDAENLLNGKRCATILDNGFITISNEFNNVRDFDIVTDIDEYIEYYLNEDFFEIKNLPYTNGTNKN